MASNVMRDVEAGLLHRFTLGPWSTDPPTEDGWYFAMFDSSAPPILVWVTVNANDENPRGEPEVHFTQGHGSRLYWIETFTHWLGPLPIPKPPENATR